MSCPRLTLTRMASRVISASSGRPMRPRVSWVCGAATMTTSAAGSRSCRRAAGATVHSPCVSPAARRRRPVTRAPSSVMRCATAPPIAPRPTTSTRAPAIRRLPSAPIASCAHSPRRLAAERMRQPAKERQRDREDVLGDRAGRHAPRVRQDDRTGDHLRKQHPADAGRRTVEPPQAFRGRQLRAGNLAREDDLGLGVERLRLVVAAGVEEGVGGKPLAQAIDIRRRESSTSRTRSGSRRGWSRPVLAAPAAALLDQPDVADDHGLVDRLDHVVDREGGDGDRRERLHLDARAARRADARLRCA